MRGREKGCVGWWNKVTFPDHTFTKKSVEKNISEFCGWTFLIQLVEECKNTIYYEDPRYAPFAERETIQELRQKLISRDQALMATSFETGGRILEVLMLRKRNFEIEEKNIFVKSMPVVKRYDKEEEVLDVKTEKPTGAFSKLYHWSHRHDAWVRRKWKTTPRLEVRGTLLIRKYEPLVKYMESWILESEDYLFPTPIKRKNGEPWISPSWAYQIVRNTGERLGVHIWNHWFRAQRASQLASEYGFREEELDSWFSWKSRGISKRYAKLATKRQEELMLPEKIQQER